MASTITLAGIIAAVQPMIRYRPLAFPGLGTPVYEPAVTMANKILCIILGPPFRWRWNRVPSQTTFVCNPSQTTPTDYPVASLSSFGWIENATVQDISANARVPNQWKRMDVVEGIEIASETGLPHTIAPEYDSGSGTITFRLMPSPDQAYPVSMDIQKKPVLFPQSAGALSQTWGNGVIPDEYSHLYTWGFEALSLLMADDPRFGAVNQKFVSALLSTHQGLNDNQKNMFLATWQAVTGAPIVLAEKLQQGIQARGV